MKGRRGEDCNIDLGLAILSAYDEEKGCLVIPRGTCLTHREIATYCGCTHQNIQSIEKRALRKLRVVMEPLREAIREMRHSENQRSGEYPVMDHPGAQEEM